MNTQTDTQANETKDLAFTKTLIQSNVPNDGKITSTFLSNPFNITVTDNKLRNMHFDFEVYVPSGVVPTNFVAENKNTEYYLEYDAPEKTPKSLDLYKITTNYICLSIKVKDDITLYLRDIDPITSSGKKVTVQPPA